MLQPLKDLVNVFASLLVKPDICLKFLLRYGRVE